MSAWAQAAKDRLERIRRGESVPGGLGKSFDVRAALKAEGFMERDHAADEQNPQLTSRACLVPTVYRIAG